MSENKLNIELFKAIREKIATTPAAYDQSVFARESRVAPCGTAACIAGWACVLSGAMSAEELKRRERTDGEEFISIEITAKHVLGLDEDEADVLFTESPEGEWDDYDDGGNDVYVNGWPEEFASQWRGATSGSDVAVAYLTHIIETGKVLE